MQLNEHVYELDSSQLLAPDGVTELPVWRRGRVSAMPYEHLRMRVFRERSGTLDSVVPPDWEVTEPPQDGESGGTSKRMKASSEPVGG